MIEIIYLNYFQSLMTQRPHQLLKQFGKNGYYSILYNINEKPRSITQGGDNYYIYNGIFPSIPKKNKRVLWISYPPLYKEIGKYNEDLLVFDCIDYPGEQFVHWRRGLKELKEKAEVIFVTSKLLYQFNIDCKSKTFLCRNGVDFEFFADAMERDLIEPKDIAFIKRPIVGYMGAVAEWIDWRLIQYLAAADKFSIVLIGSLFGLTDLPVISKNIHYLGRKDFSALADYLSCFDVCMIPFRKSKLTDGCNPIKMYEYLSMGKPVVTTDLEECRIPVVKCSKSYKEFYHNIMESLGSTDKEEIGRRISFAKENSWENRVNEIITRIEPRL